LFLFNIRRTAIPLSRERDGPIARFLWVLLLAGAARLTLEGDRPIDLRPGGFVDIPARRRHRVEWTDPTVPTIWLAIHHEAGPASDV